MEEIDKISSLEELEKNELLYIGLFQEACLEMNIYKALDYALKAYLCGDVSRERIIKEIFVVCVRDKGLANPNLFPQIYQLLSVVMKRGSEDEDEKKEDIEEEEWVHLEEYENYSFSSYGRLKMDDEIIPPVKNGKKLALRVDDDLFDIDVLVATTFVTNTNDYPIVHHINGDLSDSRYNNLKWVKKIPKILPELQPIIKLKPEQITGDGNRSSYFYRFMLAVRLVASSPCSSVNDYASYLFEDIVDTEEEEFVTKFGSLENAKINFHTAVSSKNIANSLYYARILTNHPEELKKSVSWKKVKNPYIAIWDVFSVILKNSPSHIKIYLKSIRDLATSETWVDDERHNFFHIHFIHMFCLDPITLNLNFQKGLKKRPIQTGWGEIKGTFIKDFIEATYKNKKRTYDAKIDSDIEPVLFPINIESILLEPRDESFNIDENISDLNDTFISIFENILLTGNDVSTTIKINVVHYVTNKIQKVNEFDMYSELSLFYLFFAFHEHVDIHNFIESHFGDVSELFQTNPFDCKSDLHGTYFISFAPFLSELTNCTEGSLFYRALLPKNKEKEKFKSTLDYRTVTGNYKGIKVTKNTV